MNRLAAALPATIDSTTLRLLCASDLVRFHDYRSDLRLATYQGWTPMTLESAHAFIKSMAGIDRCRSGEWIQLGVADTASDDLIGDVGVYYDEDSGVAEVGYTLAHAAQGRGHATRAVGLTLSLIFATTPATLVRALVDERNAASIRLLERLGFEYRESRQTTVKGEDCCERVYVYRSALPTGGHAGG